MGIRSIGLVVVLFVALTACGKKTYKKFYELQSQQSVLIADQADDAYVSPEMEGIVAGLDAVPDNAIEKERAQALSATLKSEKARVVAARKAPPPAPPVAAAPRPSFAAASPTTAQPQQPVAQVDQAPDAGPSLPTMGMDEAAFTKAFGLCFLPQPAQKANDGTELKVQQVRDSADCTKKYGTAGSTTMYLFGKKGLQATRTVTYFDAGAPAAPVQAAPVDAGSPNVFVPGMPRE